MERDVRSITAGTVGAVLRLIREGQATTRSELVARTGLARSTVTQRVESLLASGLVVEGGGGASTGGRPPTVLRFAVEAGVVLAADLGASHYRLEVTDLAGGRLAADGGPMDIGDGPDAVLAAVLERFDGLLGEAGRARDDVRGIGIGLPGPVEFATGRAVNPPIMPGWDGVAVPDFFRPHYAAPVLVDNDVNIMALGEQRLRWPDCGQLLFVKVATGIGCGIVAGGQVYRGAQGAAGDIGHIRVSGHDEAVCRCGNVACVEAIASGGAVARQLRELGHDTRHGADVVSLVRAGDTAATRLVRSAGRALGEVLAAAVNFFNPSVVVVGGVLAEAHEQLLAGIREVVYQRSLPLATRHLRLVHSGLGERAGTAGAALMAIEWVLSDDAVERAVGTGQPVRRVRA